MSSIMQKFIPDDLYNNRNTEQLLIQLLSEQLTYCKCSNNLGFINIILNLIKNKSMHIIGVYNKGQIMIMGTRLHRNSWLYFNAT